MSNELKNTQKDLQRNKDYDLYLSLLVRRESALTVIKTTKSAYLKKDKYKQVCKLGKQIETLRRKWGFK